MDRVAVFVDAGHLYAGGSAAISGKSRKRTEMTLDVAKVAKFLEERAGMLSGLPLLRIYWYDGALPQGLTTEQQLLASTDNVKLRLGIVNGYGEQKGVDAKIVTDLAELGRNSAICDAVLIGGDEDLRIGVELAQERGVRIHLLTVEGSNVSSLLKREADTTSIITVAELRGFLTVNEVVAPPASVQPQTKAMVPAAPAGTNGAQNGATTPSKIAAAAEPQAKIDYAAVVTQYLGDIPEPDKALLKAAIETDGTIPREHDGRVLARARDSVDRQLDAPEKKMLREEIRKQLSQ